MKEALRVAVVTGKMDRYGVGSIILCYAKYLDHSKIVFDLICDEDSTDIPSKEIESYDGRIYIIPPYQKFSANRNALYKILNENQYKIVHSHINTLSVFPLRTAKQAGVPVRIAHSHSTAGKGEWKRNLLKYSLRPFSKKYATELVACSEYAGKWLFGGKADFKVLPMSTDFEYPLFLFDEKARNKTRKEYGIEEKEIVLGHVGWFVTQKNQSFLLEIFATICSKKENVRLMMVGDGPRFDEMKFKAQELGIKEKVLFIGHQEDSSRFLQAMDIFLLPSLYEGKPIVSLEAQLAGLPLLVSDVVTKEIDFSGNVQYTSLDYSTSQWAEKAIEITVNLPERDLAGAFTEMGFDKKRTCEELEEWYMELVENIERVGG